MPQTTPVTKKPDTAIACSAVLAVSEVVPRFNARITVTIVPMPKAMTRPGSTRVSRSKTSNGTNGSPATFHPKKRIPQSAAVTIAATNKPLKTPRCRNTFIAVPRSRSALQV